MQSPLIFHSSQMVTVILKLLQVVYTTQKMWVSKNLKREIKFSEEVKLNSRGDTPIWICATTEDGYQAWSSPIYLIKW